MANKKIYLGYVNEGSLLVHVMMKSGRGHTVLIESDKSNVMYTYFYQSLFTNTAKEKFKYIFKAPSLTDTKGIVLNPSEIESAEVLEETPKLRRYNRIETEATFWKQALTTYEWIDE